MNVLRDIDKRKQLQEIVLSSYRPLSEQESREHDHEVGAAFRGYELALGDIAQLIVDGREDSETLSSIVAFITDRMNGKATKNLFRLSEIPTSRMKDYISSTVRDELVRKGQKEKDASLICRSFIEYPQLREGIIERYELDSIRICEHCGAPMCEGYLENDFNTFCSEDCAREATASMGWTENMFNERLADADSADASIYWTQWEG